MKTRQRFQRALFIGRALSHRPRSRNLSTRFSSFIWRRFNIINLPGSGGPSVSAGRYEFGNREITTAPDMPEFLLPIRTRAATFFSMDPNSLVQTTIIEYFTGSPIGWHRDIPHFGVVVGISLGGACRMKFREHDRVRSKNLKRGEILSMELQPRSIYLMSGPSRESWQHSIAPVKELRYSIMLRDLREKATNSH